MYWYGGELKYGETLTLSVTEPGLLFGATVFTTLRIYGESLDHPLTAWDAHCDRLHSSINTFQWNSPDWERVRIGADHLLSHFPVLRITLFPDGTELITGRSLPPDLDSWQQNGIIAWVDDRAQFTRSLPGHKTGNYLACWLALQQAQRQGAQEAILTEAGTGHWLETSTGSLWGWADGGWWTPPLASGDHSMTESLKILPGIGRSQLISWLKCQNRSINGSPWIPQRVDTFEALAYCNSVRQVVPIHSVLTSTGTRHYEAHHPCLKELRSLYERQKH